MRKGSVELERRCLIEGFVQLSTSTVGTRRRGAIETFDDDGQLFAAGSSEGDRTATALPETNALAIRQDPQHLTYFLMT